MISGWNSVAVNPSYLLIVFFHLDFDHYVSSLSSKLKSEVTFHHSPPESHQQQKKQTENPSETNKSHDSVFQGATSSVSSRSISPASISTVWQCIRTRKGGGAGKRKRISISRRQAQSKAVYHPFAQKKRSINISYFLFNSVIRSFSQAFAQFFSVQFASSVRVSFVLRLTYMFFVLITFHDTSSWLLIFSSSRKLHGLQMGLTTI